MDSASTKSPLPPTDVLPVERALPRRLACSARLAVIYRPGSRGGIEDFGCAGCCLPVTGSSLGAGRHV